MGALFAVALALTVAGRVADPEGQVPLQSGQQPSPQQQPSQSSSGSPAPQQPSASPNGFDERTIERIRAKLVQTHATSIGQPKPHAPLFRIEVFGRRFQMPEWQKNVSPATSAPQPFGGADYYEMMRLITPPQYWGSAPLSNRDVLNLALTAGETWLATSLVKKAIEANRNAAPRRIQREIQQELADLAAHNVQVAGGKADSAADSKATAEKAKQNERKKQAQPIPIDGTAKAPARVKSVPPVYPEAAQAAKVEGVVVLKAIIGADGRVVDAAVVQSIPLLDQAAIDAVRQWEYTPTLINGVAVPVVMTVSVSFTLK